MFANMIIQYLLLYFIDFCTSGCISHVSQNVQCAKQQKQSNCDCVKGNSHCVTSPQQDIRYRKVRDIHVPFLFSHSFSRWCGCLIPSTFLATVLSQCYTCTRLLHVTARITIRLSIYLLCRIPSIFNAVLFFEHVHLMLIGYIHPVHRWRFRCYFSCNVCALGDARWEGEGGSGTMFLCVCGCLCDRELWSWLWP